jgi:TonB family protein
MTERLALAGTVEMSILVDEKGNVAEARVLRVESRPSGAEYEAVLRDAALKSAQKWRFEPAQQGGVAVRVWLPVRIDF